MNFSLRNRYEIDLSNEVLDIYFGQGAAKISEVKVGGQKKYQPTQPTPGASVRTELVVKYFFSTSNFDLFLQPLDKNQCLVPH